MSYRDTAISVRSLSKSFTITHDAPSHTTMADAFLHALRRTPSTPRKETFWALRDVEFDVRKGEVVGIIGRNGAGKSTLLKVLSRITEPTSGCIDLYGRVGSLLEVGTGFHPELTGRENIFMNGAILGMSRREIQRQFDAIVEFAEVERFLDTPVKRYSSGMYVRLAFAVAAHLNPEILIVDEVLAVGDAEFQKKCIGKMQDVSRQDGRTVLFVSHNMAAVQSLCSRAVMLQNGCVKVDGTVSDAIALFQATGGQSGQETIPGQSDLTGRKNRHLPDELILRRATVYNSRGQISDAIPMGDSMSLVIDVEGLSRHRGSRFGVKVYSDLNQLLIGIDTEIKPARILGPRGDKEQVVLSIPRVPLVPGVYWINLDLDQKNVRMLDSVEHAVRLEVVESDIYGTGHRIEHGVIYLDADWSIQDAAAPAMRIG